MLGVFSHTLQSGYMGRGLPPINEVNMKPEAKFRYVEGNNVWVITKSILPIECQLGYNDRHTTEEDSEVLQYEENKKFMIRLMEFLSPHLSRSDQSILLRALVDEIVVSYVDMTYTEEYLRPISDALVKFLDAEKAKQKGE